MPSSGPEDTLLSQIQSPRDLRQLEPSQLPKLAAEVRDHLITSLNTCGGHFGANLGTVELTIALHYLYNTPHDRIVWDVGHQAYPHKILTGRRDQIHTIKQPGGLAPFPKRKESEYDTFDVGHSGTSISAALGMCIASTLKDENRRVVAVIGDGGLTGGMAFEALNHAGSIDPNMLIILNDNEMSISENVGALTRYFSRLLSGKRYCDLRENGKKILANMPDPLTKWVKKTETHLKGMFQPGTLFEELGFHYLGPIDGHDIDTLIKTLSNIQHLKGAKILHINTIKGKGYQPAEKDPIGYHAVKAGFLDKKNTKSQHTPITYSNVFGDWICDVAQQDNRLIGITPAMREGSDLVKFSKMFPERYFDVSIAEQHAVTFAAGLACEGKKPVVAIYSTFLQRAYDQLIHDVALQNLDVTFAIDRAGLVGSDGPTHAGSFDLSYLRCVPNMVIMAPSNENECRQMLYTAYQYPGPAAVRYPRGSGNGHPIAKDMKVIPIGTAETTREGKGIVILAFGSMLKPAMEAGEILGASVVNMRFVKPIDEDTLCSMARQHQLVVTIEENRLQGGAGSAVVECLNQNHILKHVLQLGLPDWFIEHGNVSSMLANCDLDAQGIVKRIQEKLKMIN